MPVYHAQNHSLNGLLKVIFDRQFMHMKKLLPLLCALLIAPLAKAQFFKGLQSSPYGGVTNVSYNPAIADNRFIADINLIGAGFNLNNNYVGVSRDVLLKSKTVDWDNFQDLYLKERLNGKDKYLYTATQIQGPLSFMFSWGKKKNNNALAFTYNFNSVTNVDNIDETFTRIAYYGVGYKADSLLGFRGASLNDENMSVKTNTWIDYGITYSRVVWETDKHMIKVGGTLKFIQGISGGYAFVKDLKYKWENYDTLSIFQTKADYKYSKGFLTSDGYAPSDLNNFYNNLISFKYSTPSAAVDLGLVYEWRPDKEKYKYQMDCEDKWRFDKNRYTLAAGFSLIDFGAINYKKGEYSGNFVADIQNWDVKNAKFPDGVKSIDDTIRARFVITPDQSTTFRMWLPTRFNFFVDYNIAYGFGVNANAMLAVDMSRQHTMAHHVSAFTLTPKFDHSWFGLYLPLTYDVMGNFSWGATMRLGPLIVGGQDLLGMLIKKHSFGTDIHVALKIPIPYHKIRDHDKDGVSNKKDMCKKEIGTCLTKGCPDKDGDGVKDADDKCPDVPGPIELNGCPDTDRDGIIDIEDSCVYDPGLAEFHGCPDRDSDRIIDKLDECPDAPGVLAFNGCPDRDNDSVPDKADRCPDVPGDINHFGCPDTDGDGLYDYEDKCIQVKGPKENNGCPWPDTDGDGVYDKDDQCPKIFGVAENKGCPQLEKKEIETVKYAFENLEFETGKDIIRKSSYASLNALADLLVKKANYGLRIEGHTDNVGSDENNLILSNKRANAVKNYLAKKGVDAGKLEAYGYGESRPVATNDTPEGRQKNRRVEMTITFK